MNTRGAYIVIEGIEAVGKTTALERLARELQAAQFPVRVFTGLDNAQDITAQAIRRIIDDPRYPVSSRAEVLLYNAARSQALEAIRQARAAGAVCLVDHSYLATLVTEYYGHGDITDYAVASQIVQFAAGHVQPDLLILLDAPVGTVRARLGADRHAAFDEAYQERLRAGYLWEAKQRNLPIIFATEPADTVFAAVWQQVSNLLSARAGMAAVPSTPSVAEVLAANPPAQAAAAEPPVVVPATQTPTAQTVESTAQTSSASGTHQHSTIEAASELLAGRLMQNRGTARITQTAEVFDAKDAGGRYHYYAPTSLSDDLRDQYVRSMDQLFDTYAGLVASLTKYIQASGAAADTAKRADAAAQARAVLRPLLPAAAATTITIDAHARTLEKLARWLQSDALTESSLAGQQLSAAVGDTAAYRAATFQAVQKLADDLLPASHTAAAAEPLELAGYVPHNELDMVADILYEHSDLPFADIQRTAASTPYQRKTDVITAYFGDRPDDRSMVGPTLESVRYRFDVTCSYAVFRELQQLRPFRHSAAQRLSPRLGYDIPPLVETAGAADVFERCFDLSLQLYSALQAGGFPLEAQYATLLGHNLRWGVTVTARDVLKLCETLASAQTGTTEVTRELLRLMLAKITEVHPVFAEAMHLHLRVEPHAVPSPELPLVQPNQH